MRERKTLMKTGSDYVEDERGTYSNQENSFDAKECVLGECTDGFLNMDDPKVAALISDMEDEKWSLPYGREFIPNCFYGGGNIMSDVNNINKEKDESKVYMASDIQKALGLGRTKTYNFLNEVYKQKEPPFRVIKVGALVRVPKQSFDNWLNSTTN